MSERRVFGDAVAHSLGLHDAPMLAIRTLRASSVAATRISCGSKQLGMTPQIPPEDSFIVAQYLTRLPYHELWSGGRPLLTQGYATNAMRIVNLTGEFSARITHPHEALTFHIPRAALDELADDAGRRRLAHLTCTPGIVDPVLVHLAAALLPAFERPEQANSLFEDYIMLAVCSYLADKYGDGAPPPAVRKGGLTTAQLRRAKEMLVANSSGHILLADVAQECGLSRQYFQGDHRPRAASLAAAASDRPGKAAPERNLATDRRYRDPVRLRGPKPSHPGVHDVGRSQPCGVAAAARLRRRRAELDSVIRSSGRDTPRSRCSSPRSMPPGSAAPTRG
jgi:AraC family transcriptional regulator